MLFNSLQFVVFFFIVTIAYFQLPHRVRWILLLAASCYFYMAFVPKYILIIGLTIVIDYFAGIWMSPLTGHKRKMLLVLSLLANIGILVFFKYYNFLNDNISGFLVLFHQSNPIPALKIMLPIGLSFHTFQAMSYTIEVYRGNQKPERHFGIYALYVMFYPQMVAGPIERPQNMLHQFHEKHVYNWEEIKEGIMQMLTGFVKKVVIADRLASVVDYSYKNAYHQNGLSTLVAVVFYSFQIYCDFSGYSDIALGAARVMGFRLMTNFDAPYLSKSIGEFWRRWHISLSTWFRDFLYIPLGGNRVSTARWVINIVIVFGLSGIWHGASWVFLVWGLLHGFAMVFEHLTLGWRKTVQLKSNKALFSAIARLLTFAFVSFAWIFFRAPTFHTAKDVIINLTHISIDDKIVSVLNSNELVFCILLIIGLMVSEKYLHRIPVKKDYVFWTVSLAVISFIYVFGVFNEQQFIYFQF